MSDYEQRNHNFYKGVTDAQFAYNEAERRVVELEDENDKLRKLARDALTTIRWCMVGCYPSDNEIRELNKRSKELGIEVGE